MAGWRSLATHSARRSVHGVVGGGVVPVGTRAVTGPLPVPVPVPVPVLLPVPLPVPVLVLVLVLVPFIT